MRALRWVPFLCLLAPVTAFAQEPPEPIDPPVVGPSPPVESPKTPAADSRERRTDPIPKPIEAPETKIAFEAEPVRDLAIIAIAAGFAGVLDLVNGTGEIRPQEISSTFDRSQLLGIDRGALSQNVDSSAGPISNVILGAAVGFAILDPVLDGFREHNVQAAFADGVIYAESLTITYGLTNLAKLAVRRPRPSAYLLAEQHRNDPTFSNADTDSTLSFFSGHAAVVAATSATATYLAFARSPHGARPWITLLVGAAATSFVSFERVRAGKHFPTDVIAGSLAGAGVGVLVPHFHRQDTEKQRPLWVGYLGVEQGTGGGLQLSGQF